MPPRPRPPEFLERNTYRLRRLMDAARFLPIFGLILLLLPLMRYKGDGADQRVGQEAVYLFVVWIALVLAAFLMSLGLRRALVSPPGADTSAQPPEEKPLSGPTPPDVLAPKQDAQGG